MYDTQFRFHYISCIFCILYHFSNPSSTAHFASCLHLLLLPLSTPPNRDPVISYQIWILKQHFLLKLDPCHKCKLKSKVHLPRMWIQRPWAMKVDKEVVTHAWSASRNPFVKVLSLLHVDRMNANEFLGLFFYFSICINWTAPVNPTGLKWTFFGLLTCWVDCPHHSKHSHHVRFFTWISFMANLWTRLVICWVFWSLTTPTCLAHHSLHNHVVGS